MILSHIWAFYKNRRKYLGKLWVIVSDSLLRKCLITFLLTEFSFFKFCKVTYYQSSFPFQVLSILLGIIKMNQLFLVSLITLLLTAYVSSRYMTRLRDMVSKIKTCLFHKNSCFFVSMQSINCITIYQTFSSQFFHLILLKRSENQRISYVFRGIQR